MMPFCERCHKTTSYTHVAPYLCEPCIEEVFYSYWALAFAQACAIACQNGDDDIKRQRLFNELRELGMV